MSSINPTNSASVDYYEAFKNYKKNGNQNFATAKNPIVKSKDDKFWMIQQKVRCGFLGLRTKTENFFLDVSALVQENKVDLEKRLTELANDKSFASSKSFFLFKKDNRQERVKNILEKYEKDSEFKQYQHRLNGMKSEMTVKKECLIGLQWKTSTLSADLSTYKELKELLKSMDTDEKKAILKDDSISLEVKELVILSMTKKDQKEIMKTLKTIESDNGTALRKFAENSKKRDGRQKIIENSSVDLSVKSFMISLMTPKEQSAIIEKQDNSTAKTLIQQYGQAKELKKNPNLFKREFFQKFQKNKINLNSFWTNPFIDKAITNQINDQINEIVELMKKISPGQEIGADIISRNAPQLENEDLKKFANNPCISDATKINVFRSLVAQEKQDKIEQFTDYFKNLSKNDDGYQYKSDALLEIAEASLQISITTAMNFVINLIEDDEKKKVIAELDKSKEELDTRLSEEDKKLTIPDNQSPNEEDSLKEKINKQKKAINKIIEAIKSSTAQKPSTA
jgi:hypothetical protein